MARIRTIKPDFFRHEGLQDLASEYGAHVMLVFAGLWGHCDKAGRFEWRPRLLKLDILPFLDFDMQEALEILARAGQVEYYEMNGKAYGLIRTFRDHQRISGKELQESEKHPEPPEEQPRSNGEATGKQQGSSGDQLESQEGKGREGNRNGVNPAPHSARFSPESLPLPCGLAPEKWAEWIAYRRKRRLSTTEQTARKQLEFLSQCLANGQPAESIINASITNGWQGLFELKPRNNGHAQHLAHVAAALTGRTGAVDARTIDGTAVAVD